MQLAVVPSSGTVAVDATFPSIPCVFKWTKLSDEGQRLLFRSDVIQGKCIGSWVRVDQVDAGSAKVSWHKSQVESRTGVSPVMIGTISHQR